MQPRRIKVEYRVAGDGDDSGIRREAQWIRGWNRCSSVSYWSSSDFSTAGAL